MVKKSIIIASTIPALFLPAAVYADIIGPSPVEIGGIFLIGFGIIVGIISLIAWLIIKFIKKRNAEKSTAETTQNIIPPKKNV